MLRSSLFKQLLTVDLWSIGKTLRSPVAKRKSSRRVPHSVRSRRALIECLEQRVVFNIDIATGVPALHGNPGAAASWSNGSPQDDMAILAGATNGFGYRADDRGDTNATATALASTGNIWTGTGIVGTNADIDMFSFTVAVGDTYRIAVNGDTVSPNLDVMFELRNSAGQLIGAANPLDTLAALDPKTPTNQFQNVPLQTLDAQVDKLLTPGVYFLAVKGSGLHYGWIGQYSINIDNSPVAGITVTPASGKLITGEDGRQALFSLVLQTAPTSDVTIPISSTNTAEGTVSTASLIFTSANWDIPQIVTVTGVSDGVLENDIVYNIIVGAAISSDVEYSVATWPTSRQ